MVGLAKSSPGGYSLFNYVMNDKKGYEVLRNNICGETPLDVMREMKIYQDQNQRATNKLMSFVLSPHINDGHKLSKKEFQNIAKDFLIELKIDPDKNQYVVFCHTEKDHYHLHFLLNRVQENGKLLKDNRIGKMAQWAGHRVALKNGLISALEVRIDNAKNAEQITPDSKPIRKEIYSKHLLAMDSRPKTIEIYVAKMLEQGIVFIPSINKQGDIQGFRVLDLESKINMKASDIHRDMSLKNLLDSGLYFEEKNVGLSASIQVVNQVGMKKSQEEIRIESEQSDKTHNLNYSNHINQNSEDNDQLKKKRRKTFFR